MSATRVGKPPVTLGNYQLLDELGRGTFGTVYRAQHWETRHTVAIKVIHPTLVRKEALLKRFHQECRLAAKIDHPNIVRVLEYAFDPTQPYLVMELIEGVSLGERLERTGRLPEAEAIRLMVQACQGLDQIHSLGLLHRDVKPDNLLLTPAGILKIIDLGLAKDVDTDLNLTRTGTGLGTPNFIAPEQFRDAKTVDRRSDVYGLGASFYQLVTGMLPFAGSGPVDILRLKMSDQLVPPQRLVPQLGTRTRDVILKALHLDAKQRFPSCWEFVEALVDTSVGLGADWERTTTGTDHWYVRFYNRRGRQCRATGTSAALARALRLGRLGDVDTLRLARSMAGPFRPLERCPELLNALAGEARGENLPPPVQRKDAGAKKCSSAEIQIAEIGALPPRVKTGSEILTAKTPEPVATPPRSARPRPHGDSRTPRVEHNDAPPAEPASLPSYPRSPRTRTNKADLEMAQALRPAGDGGNDWWKTASLLALIGAATFLAGQYLLPLLK